MIELRNIKNMALQVTLDIPVDVNGKKQRSLYFASKGKEGAIISGLPDSVKDNRYVAPLIANGFIVCEEVKEKAQAKQPAAEKLQSAARPRAVKPREDKASETQPNE